MLDLSNIDVAEQLREIERVECEDSLYLFLRAAWKYIDPSPWQDGWAMEAVAEHLQAVVDGDIKRLIINIPPRCSKPVDHSAIVMTLEHGQIPLGEVVIGDHVLTHKGRFRAVTAVHHQGILPTLRITSRRGRSVCAAADHPFLTTEGWSKLQDIGADDVVGVVPLHSKVGGTQTITAEEARLLGYLIGDGSCRGTPNITVADDIEADDIHKVIRSIGFESNIQTYRMANTGYMLRRMTVKSSGLKDIIPPPHQRKGFKGPVRLWMDKHRLTDGTSYTKKIPTAILRGNHEVICNFIGAYWACDGFITTKGAKRDGTLRDDLVIGCDSVNRDFIRQMQQLLLRIGVDTITQRKVSKIKTKKQGDEYISYSLFISDQDNCWRFAKQIPIHHTKGLKLADARKRRFDFDRVVIGNVVDSVEPDEPMECICLTVDEDESFTANGFAVHNSSLCSVALPAWCWAQDYESPTSGPKVPFLHASYANQLALRDSVKCRRLIESPWYQSMWSRRFKLIGDQNTKSRFGNDQGGERLITSVGAGVTGEGSNIIVIDDANNASEVMSEAVIESTLDWYTGAMRTRLNDPKTGAFIIIQQRLGEEDLTGYLLSKDHSEWTHLCLPMRYEPDRAFKTCIGWEDPRTRVGELLWPERFPEEEVRALEIDLGPWRASGQLQQLPEPKGGGIIKNEWWQVWEGQAPMFDYVLASLDTAYTMKTENDYSALTIWGVFTMDTKTVSVRAIGKDGRPTYGERDYTEGSPKIMMIDAWQERLELHDLVAKVAQTCRDKKVDKLLIENKAAGISVAQEIRRIYGYETFGVQLQDPGAQDKLARLYSVQHLFAEKIIYCPEKEWSDLVIKQVGQFPKGRHDDLVDTVSMAIRHLRDLGLLTRSAERMEEVQESLRYQGREPPPLYPA